MVATLTHSRGIDPASMVRDALATIEEQLADMPAKVAMEWIEFCRNRFAAREAAILADRYDKGASDRQVQDLAKTSAGTSKKEAQRRASRAKAANANPDIGRRMASGQLSAEQADVIAEAAALTDGAAACDADLIESIAAASPEQGRKKAKKFVNERRNADDVQSLHDKQAQQRGWYRHRLSNGNAAITFHGTDKDVDDIERAVVAGSEKEYEADGGRDVARADHPRTNDQRGFDAAHSFFSRSQSEPGGSRCSATGQRPAPSEPASQLRTLPTRHVMHINATVDQITGTDLSPITTADGKPLARSVVDEIACGCDLIGHIFSADGELLWQTRQQRLATPAQINGLIARDGGCVLCDAHYSQCVAHHLIPWRAPAEGETNIDNLAFLCGDCHTRVHQRKQTLFFDKQTKTWKTRAAKWHELPPERPPGDVSSPQARNSVSERSERLPPDKPGTGRRTNRYRPQTLKPRSDQQRNNFHRKLF